MKIRAWVPLKDCNTIELEQNPKICILDHNDHFSESRFGVFDHQDHLWIQEPDSYEN